jgi:hypothetical protein
MSLWFRSGFARAAICLAAVAAVAAAGWFLFLRDRLGEAGGSGFLECAEEAGLTWRMSFLPDEQGEKFKINLYDHGSGVAVGDFDGDGKDDIYFCNQLGPNALYRNNGNGTFTDVAQRAGVALGDRVCVGATFVDYDNSGRRSLFVTSTRGGNVLFKNLGDGTFKDVTKEAGLVHVGHSQAAVFFDFDNDGHLDLLLTNTGQWTTREYDTKNRYYLGKGQFDDVIKSPPEYNILYRNNGDGTFTNVTEKSGLKGLGWAGDAVAIDYDGDGWMDLFVGNMFGRCQLYRNNRDGTFTDVTKEVLGRTPYGTIGVAAFDATNSGRLDLMAVDMHSDMWMGADFTHKSLRVAQAWEKKKLPTLSGPPPLGPSSPEDVAKAQAEWRQQGVRDDEVFFGNGYYRNEGGGRFKEVSAEANLETFWPWGIAAGDFDNDGWVDLFIPSGMGYPFYYWPNYLLLNQRDGTFADRAKELGVEPPRRGKFGPPIAGKAAARSSRSAAVADFRGVGKLDVVVNNFNDQPYYLRNRLPRRNYVQFRLRGTKGNRDAIGAVVRLYRRGQVMTRPVQAMCGYLAQSSLTAHFGLGDDPAVDRVEITWPGGRRQVLDRPAANRLHLVTEPND